MTAILGLCRESKRPKRISIQQFSGSLSPVTAGDLLLRLFDSLPPSSSHFSREIQLGKSLGQIISFFPKYQFHFSAVVASCANHRYYCGNPRSVDFFGIDISDHIPGAIFSDLFSICISDFFLSFLFDILFRLSVILA